jgi:hypothetical protein
VIAELANGKTIIGKGLWSVNAQEVDSEEATFDALGRRRCNGELKNG